MIRDRAVEAFRAHDAANADVNAYFDIKPDRLDPYRRYQFDVMMETLEVAVPMWQDEIRQKADMGYDLSERRHVCSQYVAEYGDNILFKGKHTAEAFNRLAEGLAILSFGPAGVRFGGRRWITDPAS